VTRQQRESRGAPASAGATKYPDGLLQQIIPHKTSMCIIPFNAAFIFIGMLLKETEQRQPAA